MTSIGDTPGYSIGAFTPTQTFTNVTEVRWAINLADQWGSPALNSLVTRRTNFFRDNGNNTLTEDNPKATTFTWHWDNITISLASGSPTPQDAKE